MALATSLTVIGWLVKPLLDLAINHWRGTGAGPGLPAALERLREAVNKVLALLPIAQKIRSENKGLLESVDDLKDAAYDAEDILSELDYYRLQKEVEGKDDRSFRSSMKTATKKAVGFLSQLRLKDSQASTSSPPPSVVDNKVVRLLIPRIDEVVTRLDRIFTGVSTLLPLLKLEDENSPVYPSDRVTTSFVSSKQTMIGREETKDHIIDLLLNGQPAAASNVCVLPIIGAGGIGKTTLARVVYNDELVEKYFDCRIWLYVSENFDVPSLMSKMLESLGVQGSNNITNLDQLQRMLKENLCSKKFLLLLDDVWNDTDSGKWDMLCASLESGKPGSRILLTTRLDTVVIMVGRSIDVLDFSFKLTGLPEEEYLSLFNKCAFGGEEPSDHPYLAEIGKQIARKLGGSPLATKTVGSLLNEKLDAEHWRSILSSEIWRLPQCHDDIMPVLKLSYQHLPVHLQQCFAYCSVFPKGSHLDEHELVRMWIAHGYIDAKTCGNKRMKDIGREYFKILLAKSFFEERYYISNYVVHDLFHDLAQSVSADECFIIDTNHREVPRRVRHLYLLFKDMNLVLKKSYLRNLRTLIIGGITFPSLHPFKDGERNYLDLRELLDGLKSVRVLCFRWLYLEQLPVNNYIGFQLPMPSISWSYSGQLPHNIRDLIHLRYLDIDIFGEIIVPDSWLRLYHLQHLRSSATFPAGTLNLISLRAFCFDKMVGIEKLTCLQELDCFIIEEGRKIRELRNLNQLGGSLTLENLENVYTKEEALEAELSKKMHIRKLKLKCKDGHTLPEMAEEVFEGICPPAYIKKLVINGYGGVNTPTWMVYEYGCLSNLQTLYLYNCLKWKVLPPLGQLPFLRHLRIDGADAVEVIDRRFYGSGNAEGFPSLEKLEFWCMPQLVEWSGIGEDPCFVFPLLDELTIANCPKLEQVRTIDLTSLAVLFTSYIPLVHPENLSSLKSLIIFECEELQSLPVLPTSLEELEIEDCPQLLTLFTTEQAKTMSNLKQVSISSCVRLRSLPLLPATLEVLKLNDLEWLTDLTMEQEEKLSNLTSLRRLLIIKCARLNSLPLLPASLKELMIYECPELPMERYQWAMNGTFPHITQNRLNRLDTQLQKSEDVNITPAT